MMRRQAEQGSALLIAIVVVVLALGIGGAFVVESLFHSRAQKTTTDQDELMAMCDAGMERAKQALDMYRGYTPTGWLAPSGPPAYVPPLQPAYPALPIAPWDWDYVLQYSYNAVLADPYIPNTPPENCKSTFQSRFGSTGTWWLPPDAELLKQGALNAMKSAAWKNYAGTISWQASDTAHLGVNSLRAEFTIPVVPANNYQMPCVNVTPSSTDPYPGKVIIGQFIPLGKGAIHIYVHNNQGILEDQHTGVPVPDATTGQPAPAPEHWNQDRDFTICITVTATLPNGLQRQVEATMRRPQPPPPYAGPQFAAVTSQDTVTTLGNVSIDGRDWDINGASVVGAGTYGILSTKGVSIGGSSGVGGSGNAPPAKGAAANSTLTGSAAANKFPSGYPANPDAVLNLGPGMLKTAAINAGTYFNTEAAYLAAMPAGGWSGKVVYADFTPSPAFSIGGSAFNTNPAVLIVHTDTGGGNIQNTKGFFKGLLIADSLDHTSAPGATLGAEFLLSQTAGSTGNAFGTANTPIMFSSAVLNNLPPLSNPNATPSQMLSYRRVQ